ncbi:ABC transporter permease [Parapusillimonas sp. SGNA-6]|nr:ABC transporter permease [Parapusillimonas sp. SGNA-6]
MTTSADATTLNSGMVIDPLADQIDSAPPSAWRAVLRQTAMVAGIAALIAIALLALLAPWLTSYDPYAGDLSQRYLPPIWHSAGTWEHVFGTDGQGRDYFCRLLYGARISLIIGLSTTLISGLIGTSLGVLAGYFGGKVDALITFIITTRLSMPVTLVAAVVASLMGSSLHTVIAVLGLLLWDRFAVVSRSAVQELRSLEYVTAARALGCSNLRVIFTQILPNISQFLLVVLTIEMAHAILLESALSFLGLGVQPPLPSWGLMIAEGKSQMLFKPWLITIPGVCLFVLIMAISLVGDGLRDMSARKSTR